jgi:hypothetical protein
MSSYNYFNYRYWGLFVDVLGFAVDEGVGG